MKVTIETNDIIKELEKSDTFLLHTKGFTCHKFHLTRYTQKLCWISDFINYPGGVQFKLIVFTKGYSEADGNHLTAMVQFENFEAEHCTVYLQMLNQLGNYGHYVKRECRILKGKGMLIGSDCKTFPLASLEYSADTNTQYLKDDCLKFRLFLKVQRET